MASCPPDLHAAHLHALRQARLRARLPDPARPARTTTGIVWVEPSQCMGCKVCANACPYGARDMNEHEGYIRKCTFCKDRVREGEQPFCVMTCHQKARTFGDLDDPNSEVSKLVNSYYTEQVYPEVGTEPMIYYIPDLGGTVQ